eukprot:3816555-Prymnesium_polylepis.1
MCVLFAGLDTNFGESSQATLTLHLATPGYVAQYELWTAGGRNNNPSRNRDPTGWMFGIERTLGHGTYLELLSSVTAITPPYLRGASYGRIYTIFPPPSPPPFPPALPPQQPSPPCPPQPPVSPPPSPTPSSPCPSPPPPSPAAPPPPPSPPP